MNEALINKRNSEAKRSFSSLWPEEYQAYILTAVSGLFLVFSWFGWFKEQLGFDPAWISILISGTPIVKGAIVGLFTRGDIKAGLLVSIALIAAVAIGEYFAAGEVAFIMMIGELLEKRTVAKAKAGIRQLLSVVPPTARVRRDGQEILLPVEKVQVGDLVLVKPGERIPVDGKVISGQSAVNQAAVTGESMPVDKLPGDEVFIGSLNQLGALEIQASKVGADTTLARVVKLVEEAENSKAPVIRTADRWATWLVPVALFTAIMVFVITKDIIRAVTILIVFCPCALVLATPTAIMAGIGNAARKGILVKSGTAMELSGKLDAVVFDKTGTLTRGKPEVTAIKSYSSFSDQDLLLLAAIAEKYSEHPLSQAIIFKAKADNLTVMDPDIFQARPGFGVKATHRGMEILVGNLKLMDQEFVSISGEVEKYVERAEEKGQTAMVVAVDGVLAGVIVAADPVREESAAAVKILRENGINKILMLTGDNQKTAAAIAANTGISDYLAGQLPEQKSEAVKKLQGQGYRVAMVGDGINDAPALALADVGIAMGVAGTDVAVQTAGIALMSEDIGKISYLVKLSRRVLRIINLNILFSLLLNLIAIVLASVGIMGPVMGALVHNAGSVLVVINSGRLIKYDPGLAPGR
ncbi:MAG: cation-translocating P-type ATPase [Syntrophomonadaceae bacterium]|nr:cation-translocating P-type ATPase [Syntrophomonadaceae bacterium]